MSKAIDTVYCNVQKYNKSKHNNPTSIMLLKKQNKKSEGFNLTSGIHDE